MGLETIQKEIEEIVKQQADSQIADAAQKAEVLKLETLQRIIEQERKAQKETEDLIEQLKNMFEASAKFELKKLELTSKKELINSVFTKAKEKIESLDTGTQEKLTSILLKDAQSQIEVSLVICNEKTSRWIPSGMKVITQEMLGGIIAENSQRTLRVDNRYETILEDVRKEALKKIARGII